MDIRLETSNSIALIRTIQKLKKKIQDLETSAKIEKKKLTTEIQKYKIFKLNTETRGISTAAKYKLKTKIKNVLQTVNEDLNRIGYGFGGILKVFEHSPNASASNFTVCFSQNNEPEDEESVVEKSLFFKDKAGITDNRYHIFRKGLKLGGNVGTLNALKKLRKRKGLIMNIRPLASGYYRDPVKMIKKRILTYVKSLSEGEALDLVKIKLGCDGTNICRNVKLVNFVFSIINEKVKAASVNGCYRIGIFRINKEDYESTKTWLPTLWTQIKGLKKVFYDHTYQSILDASELAEITGERSPNRFKEIEIDYSFCNDYKMNLIILGLKAANSNWPCMYCTVFKKNLNECGKNYLYMFLN